MTDITELAQSLKAAAIDAKELAIIARYSKGRAAAEKFYALANPANILALVEALEKAQQQIIALQQRHEVDPRTHEIIDLKERIAELESRTVKLPKLKMLEDYLAEVAIEERKQILVGVKLEFHRELAAAGIKVEAE
ncbi:Ead domain protein [Klebsiella pneumoniae]|uniref:ead/Ea22-like family protein n=1 Tax=Klebsiella pneumoniae TaxID=573 RepID=UPI000E2BDDFF|nr:ead/Ea22-like family protein [Klebsiella pneumoniae]SYC73003.1 Ead domain protein [Klebsiella pneumoniae]